MLARREHSTAELVRKLGIKGFAEKDIHSVLSQLSQENLQSNDRFIENYIHFRRTKGYGPLHIKAELMARGLTEEFIEQHLNISDNAWFIAAHNVWQKKFKGVPPSDFSSRAKHMRFLHYRGFTQEQIHAAIPAKTGMTEE